MHAAVEGTRTERVADFLKGRNLRRQRTFPAPPLRLSLLILSTTRQFKSSCRSFAFQQASIVQ
jgi:hypothetical protein